MDLFRFKKSIKIFMCTVLTIVVMATSALSFSFRSHALTMPMPIGVSSYEFISSLYTLLLSGKVISDNIKNPFISNDVTNESINEIMEFFEKCNEYSPGLGDNLKSKVYSGALNGSITMSAADRTAFLEFLEYCKTNNIPIPIYSSTEDFPLNPANYRSQIVIRYHTQYNPTIYEEVISITSSYPYFFSLIDNSFMNIDPYQYAFAFFSSNVNFSPSLTASGTTNSNIYISLNNNQLYSDIDGNSFTARTSYLTLNKNLIYDSVDVYSQFWGTFARLFSKYDYGQMIPTAVNTGTASLITTEDAEFVSDSSDVISSTSTVSETGTIEGDFTIAVPGFETLATIVDGINSGLLRFKDAIAALRLSTVANDATVQEKEKAIQNLAEVYPASSITDAQAGAITVPIGATSTITDSVDEMSAVQHITHSIANTIADIRGVPRPYPDEEPDAGPAGDPYLDGWEFPSLDPDNPDPGGTDPDNTEDANRAADVVNGLAFVSGFISSFYNASKGYNMVFTVGISFVIFSVIIGASHFFGAMFGSHVSVNGPSTIKEFEASHQAQIKAQQRAYQKSLKQKRLTG